MYGPPTNRKKPEPQPEQWHPVDGKPWLETNGTHLRTKNWQPPPLPVPIVIDYTFDESGFPG
jgi:hypothetical protein